MRRIASLVALASTLSVLPALPARAGEPTPLPPDTILDIRGHGWGHGRGMGQWGAKGMADDGNTYTQILDHYYAAGEATAGADAPLVRYGQRGNPIIRVLVESSQDVIVTSRQPFTIRPHGATELSWRSTKAEPFWRITYAGGKYRYARAASWNPASWKTVATDARYADFRPGDTSLELVRNGGSVRRYRGTLIARWSLSDGMRAINNVPVEDYLRGVVPRESPSSWPAAALRAQSVAARTYAHRYRDASREGGNTFDICATTSCQVYEGSGSRIAPGGTLTVHEVGSTDAAIAATAGEVLFHASEPILAEFSSSTGGYTAPGSVPYQIAVPDPGDRVSPHHLWTASIRVTDVESRWPAIGRLVRIDVTDRNGYGDWGGRVRQLRIVGTRSSVSVSGDAFRSAFAWPSGGQVRSSWFTIGIIRAERATVPTTVSVPTGGSKRVAMRFRNVGTDPWFVGGELQLETDAPSPFRHDAWISNEIVARISDNVTRPGANLIDPGEVAEFIVVIDASDVAPGSQTMPLRLQPAAGRVIDRISLDVDVLESWIDASPNMLTSGSFEKKLAGWTVTRGDVRLLGGRDSTPGIVADGAGLRVLEQTIDLAGGTGRGFLLGGWAKRRDAEVAGSVLITYANGSSERHRLEGWSGESWRYAQRSFRTSRTQQIDRMRLRLVANVAAGGRAEFDALRLVEDPITDPSFEAAGLDGWTITAPADLPRPSRIDWAATDGRVALRVPGRAEPVALEQRFELDARAWDRLTLRFSERVYGATVGSDSWRVSLILEHDDGSETTGSIALDNLQHPWRDASLELRPAGDVHHARLLIEGANPTGRADLDAFRLLRSRHVDPSFERSDAWSSGKLGADDGFEGSAARDGSRGLRLSGPQDASSSQRFRLGGTRHRILRLSVMDVVSGRIERGDRIEVAITFFHRDGSRNTRRIPLGVRAHPWTFREMLVSSTEAFDEVRLTVSSRGHDGVVFVDQLLLTDA